MRKHLLSTLIVSGCLSALSTANAQDNEFHCGTDKQTRILRIENPALETDYREFVDDVISQSAHNEPKRLIYRIPVVVHILHEYGSENISDDQVRDGIRILNEDYRMLNADLSEVIPEFAGITADALIEFQLASIDPDGNCTNGIEHIYTHLTRKANDDCKLNQWPRERYLNIWVVESMEFEGLAGYTYYPTDVAVANIHKDGIIVLNEYIGSIGTASQFSSRFLTHEFGHFLGLAHPWGNSSQGNVCGDEGISDTPETKGHIYCPLDDDECNPGVIENVQNFMEMSFCQRMFTEGQAAFLQNAIQQETAQRNNLWTEETHTATGIDVTPPPTCKPVADFSSDIRMACTGAPIHFKDASWRAEVTQYAWTFNGGTPASSTEADPEVVYNAPGYYSVTLTVTNAAGSDTKTFQNMLYISGDWAEITGPFLEDFEGSTSNWWIVQNPEDNFGHFELTPGVGKDLSRAYKLNNYRDVSNAAEFTEDWFYPSRLGGSKDYLISPAYDLAGTSNVTVSFDYAYGTNTGNPDDMAEVLKVYSSRDCGKTWTVRKTITAQDLLTVDNVSGTDFSPSGNSEWKTETFSYNVLSQDTKTRFRFEFTASDFSNNLYIDNLNVSGVLGIKETDGTAAIVSVSPNPVQSGEMIIISAEHSSTSLYLELTDVNGALVSKTTVTSTNGTQTIEIPAPSAKGCYFLNVVRGNTRSAHKVIVF